MPGRERARSRRSRGRGFGRLFLEQRCARWTDHRSRLDNTSAFGQQCRRVRPVTAFSETIAKAYAVDGGAIDLGPRGARGQPGARGGGAPAARDDEPPRADRRRDRHRQDAHPAAARRAAFRRGRLGVRGGLQGRPFGARAARRGRRAGAEADGRAAAAVRADVVPGRVPRARRHRRRRPGPGDGDRLRAGAARQGPGCKRDAAADAVAALPVRRRAWPAS